MALVIFWYDFICFAIVAASIFTSLWIIWQRESPTRCAMDSTYESLWNSRESGGRFDDSSSRSGFVSWTQLWTTCWRGIDPVWLMVMRLASVIVMAGILAWDILRYDKSIFVYYTEWTFSLTIFYFVLATIISASGLLENSQRLAARDELEENKLATNISSIPIKIENVQQYRTRKAGFWGYLMQIVYQICAGGVILADLVFWLVIVPFLSIGDFSLNTLTACMHTFNAFFLLLDTSLNNLSFPSFRLAYFVLWSSLYVIVQWVLHAFGFPWWPYPFLELDTHWAPLWYVCSALIHFPCYGLYALIVKLKNSLFPKWFPCAFLGACYS